MNGLPKLSEFPASQGTDNLGSGVCVNRLGLGRGRRTARASILPSQKMLDGDQ